jgi:hypothetical protein
MVRAMAVKSAIKASFFVFTAFPPFVVIMVAEKDQKVKFFPFLLTPETCVAFDERR